MALENNSSDWMWLKLLCLTIITALIFEHSQFDIHISELFYTNGRWLIQKGAQPYAFIFYDAPKALLILLALYLITVLIIKYRQPSNNVSIIKNRSINQFMVPFSVREISYLLIILIVVPSTVALLKSVTHVSCPNHLTLFGGDLPYLNIWQNITAKTDSKCFPAAHASAGFSLYGLAFLPSLHKYRYRIFTVVTVLGWTMGLYKMSFGDHFFSHTLVSMLLSLTTTCTFASFLFKKATIYEGRNIESNTLIS
ncbi:PAP2 family lipid A phosphatase [Psychrobacter faecalis]